MFEYDESKSLSNLAKHNIDFIETQSLWFDTNAVVIDLEFDDEPRFIRIGLINNKHWCAIYTHRHTNIRLISCRRCRKKEVALYEAQHDRQ